MMAANDNLLFMASGDNIRAIDCLPATIDGLNWASKKRLIGFIDGDFSANYITILNSLSDMVGSPEYADLRDEFIAVNAVRVERINEIVPCHFDYMDPYHHFIVMSGLCRAVSDGIFSAEDVECISNQLNLGVWQ